MAQGPGATKRNLTPSDYAGWENLAGARISNDGHWLAYGVVPVDGDPKLTIRNCDTRDRWEVPNGSGVRFSEDSKWCAYLLSPPKAVADKLREERKPIELRLGVRELASGNERTFDHIANFRFLKSGPTILISKFPIPGKPGGGSDLQVINLTSGESLAIGNVAQAIPNRQEDLLLLHIESDSGEKGVQLLDTRSNTLKTLAWGEDDVQGVTWAARVDIAAFLLGKKDEKKDGPAYRACIASNLRDGKPIVFTLDPAARGDFPKGKRISPFLGAELNEDGTAIGFGLQEWNDLKKDDRKPEDRSNVQIWNTHDIRVMPTQILRAQADRQKSDLWVWRSKDNVVKPVAQGESQTAMLLGDFEHAVLIDDKLYRSSVTNGYDYADFYILNPWTGKKSLIESKTHWAGSVAPSKRGHYVAYYSGRNWWLADVATGKLQNLTAMLPHTFEESEDDHTVPEKPFADGPTWLKDDQGLVLGDDFDQFLVRPGIPGITELTHGRETHSVYRIQDIGDDPDGISIKDPLYFHVFGKDTKNAGYAVADSTGKGKILAYDKTTMSGLHKAKDADRVVFIMGSFEKSPDAYITNTAFTAIKPETRTNPQQALFNWGHTELVSYKSRWGVPLQGSLIYPADYVKGRRYPMITYIYERESDGLNQYVVPDPLNPYNAQILSQNGYFVLMPDIAYRNRHRPGEDAVDCLEPAVNAVFALNVGVDSNKVGLMGHSWGAYQTAFVTTVSKAFAAGVAGAPLTELTSMYNSYYWNSGGTDQEIFESSQGRMAVPFWEDPKAYVDNSPVWRSRERHAPLLFAAGDADGAVDWHQSLYLYNTLRRLGKDAVLLVYPGENHGLVRKAVRKDYSKRVRHYFDVYLKGDKPEPWITTGVPFIHPDDTP